MQLVSMVLDVRHEAGRRLGFSDSRYAHAAVMHTITSSNSILGKELHDKRAYKPITLSILSPKNSSAQLRLTFISPRGIEYANLLMTELARSPILRLGSADCEVTGVELNKQPWGCVQTWQDMMDDHYGENMFWLDFVTPTAINKKDIQGSRISGLLPEPHSIFMSLARRWNAFDGPSLFVNLQDFLTKNACIVSDYQIGTAMFDNNNFKQKGFMGRVKYEFRSENKQFVKTVLSLARFAFFSGVGYHTAQGMGVTRMIGGGCD